MVSLLVIPLLQLLLASLVSTSHYYGASMTFNCKGNNSDGSTKVEVRRRSTFDGCTHQQRPYCTGGHCNQVLQVQNGVIDQSTNTPRYNNKWCETEELSVWAVRDDKPFEMRVYSCCWIQTRNGASYWQWTSLINLGRRSDTGKPNKSPAIAILPFLRVPQNCPRTYKLISFDPDGDRVRCRYGNSRYSECNACNRPSGFNLDQDSCTIQYQYASANPRVYAFEMVVEDFSTKHMDLIYKDGTRSHRHPMTARRRKRAAQTPATTPWWWGPMFHVGQTTQAPSSTQTTTTPYPTTTFPNQNLMWWQHPTTTPPMTTPGHNTVFSPFSKLPLQFSVLIDPPAPSCQEGFYIPKFVHPTPENGAVINGEPDKIVEIRVKAQAAYTLIFDIIISGPLNITKRRTTHDEFVISFTPSTDDLGQYYAVCFAVESFSWTSTYGNPTNPYYVTHHHHHATPSSQSGIYQSEMRCVLLKIVKSQVKANVICKESSMQVEVKKSSLVGLDEDHLRLNDPLNTVCSLKTNSNSTHIIGVVPLNACGTQIEEDDDNLIFKNEITTVDDITDLITRKHLLELQFYCQYPKRGNVTLSFTGHRKKTVVWERGFGTFTYQFEFYPDNKFHTMIDPNSYPLEYELGARIYMQIEAQSSVNNTEMFVESCRAAPYDNPSYTPTYSIIENGCNVDPTVVIYNSEDKNRFQFSIEAFQFIGLQDQVYISCSVVICEAGNPNTRCSQGCTNAPWTNTHNSHHRHKRDTVIQSMNHFISQGPLRLKRSTDGRVSSGGLNLTLVFLSGCALAAVGMICGLIFYKIKTSSIKYQRLPVTES
ncbi:uncharacterized protein LOC114460864 [Gouania willdenowi]|uniref:Uncharacterized LOC114460864 n=1 Tax=Gouania willdenowi TaxID=441366 RepID=A0A8C5EP51_GOUWI|nr:uncharacterized protein LOC114460864 [Gouania willdenowi]